MAFDELYGIPADIGKFTDTGMTDPDVGHRTFAAVLGHEPTRAELNKMMERRLHHLYQTVAESPDYRVLAGVEELLPQMLEQGYLLGLVTGNVEAAAHIKLHRSRLNRFFSFGGYGSDSTDRGELTRMALSRAAVVSGGSVTPDQAFVVGTPPTTGPWSRPNLTNLNLDRSCPSRQLLLASAYVDPSVPERLRWAVQLLDIAPADEILEIGPGPGVSVSLVCEQLADGQITAIDRSATAVQRATKRNADHVASGKAVVHQLDLADVELVRRALAGQRFDKVFAVNVNLFWVRPADAELQLIKDLLGPGGVVHLIYEPPGKQQASRVAEAVTAALANRGFATASTIARSPSLLCISGRLSHHAQPRR